MLISIYAPTHTLTPPLAPSTAPPGLSMPTPPCSIHRAPPGHTLAPPLAPSTAPPRPSMPMLTPRTIHRAPGPSMPMLALRVAPFVPSMPAFAPHAPLSLCWHPSHLCPLHHPHSHPGHSHPQRLRPFVHHLHPGLNGVVMWLHVIKAEETCCAGGDAHIMEKGIVKDM